MAQDDPPSPEEQERRRQYWNAVSLRIAADKQRQREEMARSWKEIQRALSSLNNSPL